MENKHGNICCEGCGSYSIVSRVVFDGADWCSEAGEGSGFGWLVELVCVNCGRIYPVVRLKSDKNISDVIPFPFDD